MKINSFTIACLLTFSFGFINMQETKAQKNIVINLREGYRQHPFGLTVLNIYASDFNTTFIDSNRYLIIKKGTCHFQRNQYLWQNYKAGKFSFETLKEKMYWPNVDTTAFTVQPLHSTFYLLLLYDKIKNDTLFALNNNPSADFKIWKKVPFNSIPRNFAQINSTPQSHYFTFNSIELFENRTLIKRPAFLTLFVDTTYDNKFLGLQVLHCYYTYGAIKINGEEATFALNPDYSAYYFNKKTTMIKIISKESNNFRKQDYKIGDTIHINGHDIVFTDISINGKKIRYTDLGKSSANIVGFNKGYKYPSFDYVEIVSGKSFNTDSVLKKKKFLLIDFWGTWCQPCIAGIPGLIKVYEKYKNDIELISVASEKNVDTLLLLEAIKKYKMNWQQMLVKNSESEKPYSILYKYRINAYPSLLMINDKGMILMRIIGYKGTEQVGEMLKENLGY